MSFSDTPAPPDYQGLAQQQADMSAQNTAQQTTANRPTQVTPWGTSTWTQNQTPGTQEVNPEWQAMQDKINQLPSGLPGSESIRRKWEAELSGIPQYTGDPGQVEWTQNIELTPQQQAALDDQMAIQAGRSDLALDALGRARTDLSQPMDWNGLPSSGGSVGSRDLQTELTDPSQIRQSAEDALYSRMTSRMDPQWNQRAEALDVRLRNQGLMPGDEAYDRAMGDMETQRTDAYQTAMNEAIMGGGTEAERQFGMELGAGQFGNQANLAEYGMDLTSSKYDTERRNQAIAEELQRRGASLNEINALLSGQQVGMPTMPGFAQSGVSQTPNLVGAASQSYQGALDQSNAQQMGMQGLMSGLGLFAL